jgi:hypothetical protein
VLVDRHFLSAAASELSFYGLSHGLVYTINLKFKAFGLYYDYVVFV